jgi:hypothetical protein
MPSIRVVHFGLGPIGSAIAQEIAQRQGFKIVGGIDTIRQKRDAISARWQAERHRRPRRTRRRG